MPHSLLKIVWDTTLVMSTIYVARRGGRDERLLISVFFTASIATSYLLTGVNWLPMKTGAIAIGVFVTISFGAVAMVSDRWWPLWATSFQIISTLSFLASDVDRLTRPIAAYFGTVGWDYLTLLAIVIGTKIETTSKPGKKSNHAVEAPRL